MNINISIEARMTSSRLPGKVLKMINHKENLSIMYDRIKKAKLVNNIIVATTTNEEDNVIIDWCKKNNVDYFRGSESNVYDRVVKAHEKFNTDVIVEVTGDCPLLDPLLIDEAINIFLMNNYDYVSNSLVMTYPLGMSVQVYSLHTLKSVSINRKLEYQDQEHVTPYLYTSGKYKTFNIEAPDHLRMPELSITLDTMEDFRMIETVCKAFSDFDFSLEDIINFVKNNKDLLEINEHIKRKGLN